MVYKSLSEIGVSSQRKLNVLEVDAFTTISNELAKLEAERSKRLQAKLKLGRGR